MALLLISYLVFSRPSYDQSIPHIDKVGHLGSFFILAALAHFAFRPKCFKVLFILSIYAGLIELVQSYLPYRTASWGDLAADIMGIALFYSTLYIHNKLSKH